MRARSSPFGHLLGHGRGNGSTPLCLRPLASGPIGLQLLGGRGVGLRLAHDQTEDLPGQRPLRWLLLVEHPQQQPPAQLQGLDLRVCALQPRQPALGLQRLLRPQAASQQLKDKHPEGKDVEAACWGRKVWVALAAHLRRGPVEAQLAGWVPLPRTAHSGVGVRGLTWLHRDHEAQVNHLQVAPRPAVQQEDVAATEVSVDHAELLHVHKRFATVPNDRALLGLIQRRAALDDCLQQLPAYELHDDVRVACQRGAELALAPAEARVLEAPAHLVKVAGPMHGEARVVLQVPHEQRSTLWTVPAVGGVVQALHGPTRLTVERIDMPVVLRGSRHAAELGDLDGDLAQAPPHVLRTVNHGQPALTEFLKVVPASLLLPRAVCVRQREEDRNR
mmetsp:Transcript_124381/g.346264  ORF Transcript_124381/g.346264 Transcript_124381/m.346264 type:complete len:390 (-) Transcript_124381:129-1298(-)